jgi:hypothetical protein
MPDFTITEPGFSGFYGPYLAGDAPAAQPPTSPWTLDTPGDFLIRLPEGVSTATCELYGAGGLGAKAGVGAGGVGAGGGGYAKISIAAPFFHSLDVLEVVVGTPPTPTAPTPSAPDTTLSIGGVLAATGGHGGPGTTAGVGSVAVVAGGTKIAVANGTAGSAAVGTTGGAGGAGGGPAGGAGGAGGASGKKGTAGSAPAGGGGGNGDTASGNGGAGGHGRVVITWP